MGDASKKRNGSKDPPYDPYDTLEGTLKKIAVELLQYFFAFIFKQ